MLKPFVVLYKIPDKSTSFNVQGVGAQSAEEATVAISEYLSESGHGEALILGVLEESDLSGMMNIIEELKERIDSAKKN